MFCSLFCAGRKIIPAVLTFFFCIIFSIVAGSYEQTALFLCLNLFIILLCYPQSRKSWFVYTLMILVGLCACITIFAPGNFLRYSAEMARWYPDFNKNAYFENSFNVIKLIFESILILNIRLYIFICAVILFAVCEGTALRKSAWQNVALGIAVLPTIVFGFGFMSGLSMHPSYEKEQSIGDSASFYLHMPEQYASIILSFIALACFLLLVYFVLRYKRSALAQICMFVIGCLTFYMLSFSPTLYASGYRTHFIMNVTLWLLAGFLVAHVKNTRHLRWLLALSILCASTQLIHVLGKFSRYFSM